jgi:hypothetical protein
VALDEAEVDRLAGQNVVIDARSRPLTLKTLSVETATGATALRMLTTGAVRVEGAVSGSGTGTLQIGGNNVANPVAAPDRNSLAFQIAVDIGESGSTGGSLSRMVPWTCGATDRLRPRTPAQHLCSDERTGPEQRRRRGGRREPVLGHLYRRRDLADVPAAKLLRVSYSDFALFQNTSAGIGGGVVLNTVVVSTNQALALQLFSTGETGENSFALSAR